MSGWWLAAFLALWLLFLALTAVVVSVVRNVGVLTERVHRGVASAAPVSTLSVGQTVPPITLTNLDGIPTVVPHEDTGARALAIISPHCGPCHDLIQHLTTTTAPLHPTVMHTTLLSIGTTADIAALVERATLPDQYPVFIDDQGMVAREWGITATPTFLVVDADGRLQHQQAGWNPPSAAGDHR